MKVLLLLAFVAGAFANDAIIKMAQEQFHIMTGRPYPNPDAQFPLPTAAEFEAFIQQYNKVYTRVEKVKRFQTFQMNGWIAQAMQTMEEGSAEYGVTQFSDITPQEFKAKYRNMAMDMATVPWQEAEIPEGDTPASIDWRKKGAVTGVKNQGNCGSCWAFSTTGNVEGQWFIKYNHLYSLSESQIVDCDTGGTDQGCQGGLPSEAYKYIMKAGGLETEADYPYVAADGTCKSDPSKFVVNITGSLKISQDEGKMATWCASNGPISIGINAAAMQLYKGGIAKPREFLCNPNRLDHGVLIVGYGTQNNEPYWIIKNSWGTTWGEEGYYYVYRGIGACGLNQMCTSCTV